MINAIAKLGEYVVQENPEMDILDMIIDNAYDEGKNKHLFVIVFRKDEKWQFKEIQYRELANNYKNKILYKRGSSKGTDFTPTTKITDLENRTFPNKVVSWFKQQKDSEYLSGDEKTMLNEINELLIKYQPIILQKLNEQIAEVVDH